MLHATYDGSGRVSWIEVQGGKSAFTYRDKSTRAVDGLNRTTVFHRTASGLTEAVDSPAGNFSQLSFDASGRPVAVARDGVNVAALGYDAEGRLRSLRDAAGETHLAHGPHGLAGADGAQSASYGYDADGRLSFAADADGARSYGYDSTGFPNWIELGQWKTTLRHDAQGQTTVLSRDGRALARYAYRPDGRVASIAFGDKGGAAAFVYDRRGLRERAAYGSDVASAMRYDAAGNLVSFSVESPQGKRSQEYELGGYNEVARIRNGGDAPGPDVTFRYDPAGNAVAIQAGGRSSTASYDALDRVTRVTLDGETVVDYAYGPLDQDAVAAADRRTGETLAPFGLSPVFGTMDSVLYARPRPATHAAVAYVPALKTFEAGWRHLAPDALRLASLRQRNLPVRGDALDPAPFGHDKPSNSLFLPPEYRAVNCRVCSSSVRRVRVTAAGRVAGRTTTVSVGIDGTCVYGYPEDGPSGGVGGVLRDTWGHTLSFGDGTPAAAFTSPSNSASRGHVYRRAGTYQVRDDVDCRACNSLLVLASGSTTVTIADDCGGIGRIASRSPDPEPLDTASLTAGTQAALGCLERAVMANGGRFNVTSGYRSQSYQDHIREVWDKYQIVRNWPKNQCRAVGDNVRAEWDRHNLIARPAAVSRHTNRTAFDATWGTLNAGVSIDELARGCNLSRPFPTSDPVHFVY